MAGLSDFVFGRGALKKAAGTGETKAAEPSRPAGLDMAKLAQDAADRSRKSEAPKAATKKSPAKRATKR